MSNGNATIRSAERRLSATVAICSLAGALAALAQEPEMLLSEPDERVLVVHETVAFVARAYEPPYELQPPKSESEASYATPEAAVEAWLGAGGRGDREWLFRTFDAELRDTYQTTPEDGRAFDYWFRDRRVVLGHRLEVEGLTLVEIESFDRQSGERVLWYLLPMVRVEGQWRLGDLPVTPLFAALFKALMTDFDFSQDRLLVDRGHVMRTAKPL